MWKTQSLCVLSLSAVLATGLSSCGNDIAALAQYTTLDDATEDADAQEGTDASGTTDVASAEFPPSDVVSQDADVAAKEDADVAPDVAADVEPDVAPDVEPDVAADVAPDAGPDTEADVPPDVAQEDTGPDVAAPECITPADCGGTDTACQWNTCENGACGKATAAGGTPCDDGNACTINDACDNATCVGPTAKCDDGLPCTTDECNVAGKCDHTAVNAACDDGNQCTTDTCTLNGGCSNAPMVGLCDDGDSCTQGDYCDGTTCVPAKQKCDDQLACTTDSCDAAGQCSHVASDAACEDGNQCTTDACSLDSGCGNVNKIGLCDDGDPCTQNEFCDLGTCTPAKATCDDKLDCTADTCDATGQCSHVGSDAACGDGNACTTDTCSVADGCINTDVSNGTTCTDNDACTAVDTCVAGLCASGVLKDCDDKNPCTTDSCNPKSGLCKNEIVTFGTSCDDGVACTTADACNAQGQCVGVDGCPKPVCNATPRLLLDYPDAIGSVSAVTVMDDRVIFGVRDPGGNKWGKVVSCPKLAGCGTANANMKTIVDQLIAPISLVPHGTRILIGDAGAFGSGALDGYVIDCDGQGCAVDVVQLAFGLKSLTEAIVYGDLVAWYASNAAGVNKAGIGFYDLAQNNVLTSLPLTEANLGLATDGTAIYTSSQYTPQALEKVSAGGVVSTLLGDTTKGGGSHRYGVSYVNNYVYWVASFTNTDAGLWRIDTSGQNLTHVKTTSGSPRNLLMDGDNAYYKILNGPLARWNLTTSTETELYNEMGQLDGWPFQRVLAVDDKCLYFGTIGGAVYTVSK